MYIYIVCVYIFIIMSIMHVISVGTSFPRSPSNMELAISVIRLNDECNVCSA